MMAVEIEVGAEAHTLKLNEVLHAGNLVNGEMFPIPYYSVGKVVAGNLECLAIVPCPWQCHIQPSTVIKRRLLCVFSITDIQQPATIKIQLLPLDGCCLNYRQQHGKNTYSSFNQFHRSLFFDIIVYKGKTNS